tara:strand:+ start:454 stop:588 length:135 start_codon:yes stop_codon:yes gene_type:complete
MLEVAVEVVMKAIVHPLLLIMVELAELAEVAKAEQHQYLKIHHQ